MIVVVELDGFLVHVELVVARFVVFVEELLKLLCLILLLRSIG